MKLSAFKTNKAKEQDGVWVPAGEDLRLRVARLGNDQYRAYVRKVSKTQQVAARLGGTNDEEIARLTKDAVARYVLVDWENLHDDDGAVIPYSVEKAREFLDIQDFYNTVLSIANDMNNFRDEAMEEARGNS